MNSGLFPGAALALQGTASSKREQEFLAERRENHLPVPRNRNRVSLGSMSRKPLHRWQVEASDS